MLKMEKPKIVILPPNEIGQKENVLFRNDKLINIISDPPPNNILYQGNLTPEYQDQHEEDVIGYGNWPEDEIGIYGEIYPLDENILHLAYYSDRAVSGGAIIVIGYHLTKITIGELEFTDYYQVTDENGNDGTIFNDVGEESPFIENIPIEVILYS